MAKMQLIFSILVQACVAYSFLLPNTTRLSLFEYQHLSQLVYNGESRIAMLEQELMTLKSIHDQAIADMDARYNRIEQKLNDTKSELNATMNDHSVTKAMLDEQIRTAGYMKQAMEKEKINRHQLQLQYTELMNDFRNLSHSCHGDIETLNQRIKQLENQTVINYVNDDNTTDLMKRLESVEQLQRNFSISKVFAKISVLDANVSSIVTDASSCNSDVLRLQNRIGYQSGFTVRAAAARIGPLGTGTTIFPLIQSNVGAHYNVSTGQFICVYPGTYFFSLSLYKHVNVNQAFCSIRKNKSGVVQANSYVGGTNSGGNNEASTSIVLHLVRGDAVDLGSCSSPQSIENYSSFSGVLLRAD